MKVELLVAHREERYPGEHAPEVLAVCDEWTLEDNPKRWADEIAKQKAALGDDAAAWAVVTASIPDSVLMQALYPDRLVVGARVTASRKV